MASQRLLLFGDETAEKVPAIRNLVSLSRTSSALRRFLQEATDVVQREVVKLAPNVRDYFIAFEDLITLAEENAKADQPNGVVSITLITVERLGELIIHAEHDPTILGSSTVPVHMLGLCTGLLPAAAAALSSNVTDLHQYGLEIVAISVRLANALWSRSKQIEASPGSWAYSIVGATPHETQSILDKFHAAQGVPHHRQVFAGVTSRTWTTVFGPPSVLAKLWNFAPELGLAPRLKLDVDGAVHAAHLPMVDMDAIIGDCVLLDTPYPADAQIFSSSTSKPFVASDLRSLLHEMILDIAQNTLRLTETVQSLVNNILRNGNEVDVIVVGPTAHTRMVEGALKESSVKVSLITQAENITPIQDLRGGSEKIAIVGMSGRFPGSEDIHEFWESLLSGADFHQKIPPSRFDLSENYDPTGAMRSSLVTPYGCFLEHPGAFDSRLFNVSPREAMQMDPVQRLLLMVSYEAMEMSGYSRGGTPSTDPKRIATYMAQTTDDWREVIQSTQGVDIYYIPGHVRAFTPGRIHYHFKWEGASHSVDAACSGSSTAVQLACRALLSRECDTALAGGGAINTAPAAYAGCGRGGFLSATGGCKTFRDDADGYCRGDGVGVVVLKRLEDALAENDNVLAVISGSARTYSAGAASITAPHRESQTKIYRQVLHQASFDPLDIGYIEMHGTGTQLGDSTEMRSVCDVFGEGRLEDHPLVLGAVKANVGHGEAVAGVTSLIKCVMMLQHGGPVPPQPGMPFILNHKFPPLKKYNIKIADGSAEFHPRRKGDGRKKLLLNNFDASGGNTCLALEEPPEAPQKREDPRAYHAVVCSARTPYSLKGNKQRLLDFLEVNPDAKISDIAYTTTARRMHDILRDSYVVQTPSDLAGLLASDLQESGVIKGQAPPSGTTVVFAFTGQGSLYAGMGKKLFETCSRFRESILSYQKICDFQGLPHVVDIIANADIDSKTKSMVQVQLAIAFLELALADLWKSWGVQPDLLIGHSLGEYAAMCTAGVLSITDALYLVGRRSIMIEEKCKPGSHAMLAVATSAKAIEEILAAESEASYEISAVNAPNSTVLSGQVDDLHKIQSLMQLSKIRTTFLDVAYGFHSAQMEPILEDLEISARGITFAKPSVPIASTLTGNIVTELGTFSPHYLARQAREPVNFVEALHSSKSANLVNEQTLWVEIGPDPVCLGLVRSTLEVPSARLSPSIKSSEDNWKTISTCVATLYTSKIPISWPEYHREYTDALTLLELPTYAFEIKDYWATFKKERVVSNAQSIAPSQVTVEQPRRKVLETTCLQYVENEFFNGDEATVTFSAHTSDPQLFDAIQGHMVDNTAICPASVFCDMALTAARYTYVTGRPGKPEPRMSIFNMDITHPLVVPRKVQEQMAEVTAVKSLGNQWSSVQIIFRSKEGSATHEHGTCEVRFGQNDGWKANFSRSLPLVKKRIDDITKSAIAGQGYRLQRPIVYKLFASLVDYSENYQGLDEVYLDSEHGDAAARIKLQPVAGAGCFTLSPYWMDAVVHLAGFLLNGDIKLAKDIVFISNGFESFQSFEELSDKKTYTSYVSMHPGEKRDVLVGDVYVFDEDKLVALCAGLLFSRMTKRVLSIIFGLDNKSHSVQNTTSHSKTTAIKPTVQSKIQPAKASQVQPVQPSIVAEKRDQPLMESRSSSPSTSGGSTTTPSSQTSLESAAEADTADVLLGIVASESGFDVSDMHPSTLFADMGVDSLMSIAIISAIQRQTGTELAASFFDDHPAVADVKREFGKPVSRPAAPQPAVSRSAAPQPLQPQFALPQPGRTEDTSGEPDVADVLLDIVASESGFDIKDMELSTLFADMGVDSLMSIAIISAIQRQTGTELAASFFDDHPTVADVRREFGKSPEPPKPVAALENRANELQHDLTDGGSTKNIDSSSDSSGYVLMRGNSSEDIAAFRSTQDSSVDLAKPIYLESKKRAPPKVRASVPKPVSKAQVSQPKPEIQLTSNVVLIRGRPSSKETPLFLATDGAGSATAYIHLPALSTGTRIYALESPFLPDPTSYNCSVEELCSMFCTAIRKVQPRGPYIVGGWSAGAAYAYEISRQLLAQNERILGLILIDMRVPRPMPDALEPNLKLLESAGLFTGIERSGNANSPAAKRLKQHLASTVAALVNYDPIPLEASRRPAHSFIIWARQGLSESRPNQDYLGLSQEVDTYKKKESGNVMEDSDLGVRGWFYDKREVFGANGWDRLVGDLECFVLDGADHFSMVVPPKSKDLGQIIDVALKRCFASQS